MIEFKHPLLVSWAASLTPEERIMLPLPYDPEPVLESPVQMLLWLNACRRMRLLANLAAYVEQACDALYINETPEPPDHCVVEHHGKLTFHWIEHERAVARRESDEYPLIWWENGLLGCKQNTDWAAFETWVNWHNNAEASIRLRAHIPIHAKGK